MCILVVLRKDKLDLITFLFPLQFCDFFFFVKLNTSVETGIHTRNSIQVQRLAYTRVHSSYERHVYPTPMLQKAELD